MTDPIEPTDNERALALVSTMMHKIAVKYAVPDETMNEIAARSLNIVLCAEAEEPKAKAFVYSAMMRPQAIAQAIREGREAKTVN